LNSESIVNVHNNYASAEQEIKGLVITLKNTLAGRERSLTALVVLVFLTSVAASINLSVKAQNFPEYERYVQYIPKLGGFGELDLRGKAHVSSVFERFLGVDRPKLEHSVPA
jgi:hypothetical protein